MVVGGLTDEFIGATDEIAKKDRLKDVGQNENLKTLYRFRFMNVFCQSKTKYKISAVPSSGRMKSTLLSALIVLGSNLSGN